MGVCIFPPPTPEELLGCCTLVSDHGRLCLNTRIWPCSNAHFTGTIVINHGTPLWEAHKKHPFANNHPRRLEAAPLLAYQSECPVDHGQNSDDYGTIGGGLMVVGDVR